MKSWLLNYIQILQNNKSKTLPENFENYFTRIENMHSYNLRSIRNKTFYTKSTKTIKYRNWLTNAGVNLWKDITSEMKMLPYKSFSNSYKKNIVESY